MEVYGYVYLIRNRVNGRVYVGQTVNDIKSRWYSHVSMSENAKPRMVVCRAIKKHGKENFDLVELHRAYSRDELDSMEVKAIFSFEADNPNFGYNVASGGAGPKNYKVTKQQRDKISAFHKGRKQSDTQIANRVKSLTGKKRTLEQIKAMSEMRLGKQLVRRKDSGLMGVTFNKLKNRYVAQCCYRGAHIFIGYYKSAQEAANAYNLKALELWGEVAVLNDLSLTANMPSVEPRQVGGHNKGKKASEETKEKIMRAHHLRRQRISENTYAERFALAELEQVA